MASLTRQRRAAFLGRGPWERCAARCAVKTRPRQAPRGPTDASIRIVAKREAAGSFAGGGVGLLGTSTAATVEANSVGGPAREHPRRRPINHVIRLHAVRNLLKVFNLIEAISLAARNVQRYVGREADPT